MLNERIRHTALKGASWGTIVPTEEDVDAIVAKTLATGSDDPVSMAFIVGRNWAISVWRKARAEARAKVKEARSRAKQAQAEALAQARAEAVDECLAIIGRLLQGASQGDALKLEALRLVFCERVAIADLAVRHGLSRANADQRLHRARALVAVAGASENLRVWLKVR